MWLAENNSKRTNQWCRQYQIWLLGYCNWIQIYKIMRGDWFRPEVNAQTVNVSRRQEVSRRRHRYAHRCHSNQETVDKTKKEKNKLGCDIWKQHLWKWVKRYQKSKNPVKAADCTTLTIQRGGPRYEWCSPLPLWSASGHQGWKSEEDKDNRYLLAC